MELEVMEICQFLRPLALLISLQVCSNTALAAPSPATIRRPPSLIIEYPNPFNTSSLLRPDWLRDPFNIPASPISNVITEIYSYGAELDIEEVQLVFRKAEVEIEFPTHRNMNDPIGSEEQLVYTTKEVTMVFVPRRETTWLRWLEACESVVEWWGMQMGEGREAFAFQFFLVVEGEEGDWGHGWVEERGMRRKAVS